MGFKGTKGEWRKFQLPNGNMKITSDSWREFAEIEFNHYQNTEERRRECLYNALLISKAPDMLEMLIELYNHLEGENHKDIYVEKLETIIKQATEL